MSKFLLNLLLQISKALVYSKIKFLFEKEFSFTFGPIGPAASQPSCGPLVFFFNRPLPLSPLGLSPSAGPARRLGPADRASVAPCPNATSHSRKRISGKLPSLHECVLHRKSATSARPISAGLATPPPTSLGLPTGPNRPAHLASQPLGPCVPLAYFAEDVFFFDSRLLFSALSLSPLADAWAPLVSSFLHPALADPDCATAESCHVRPLRAAGPHLEMPPQAVTRPTITPPSSSRTLTCRDKPIYSAIEATPLASRYPAFTAVTPLLPTL
jgi:hypothetical protein